MTLPLSRHLAWVPVYTHLFLFANFIPVSSREEDRNQIPKGSSDPFVECFLLGCILDVCKGNPRSLAFQTQAVSLLALKAGRLFLSGG